MASEQIQLLRIDNIYCHCAASHGSDTRIVELRFDTPPLSSPRENDTLTVWCGNCNSRIYNQSVIVITP